MRRFAATVALVLPLSSGFAAQPVIDVHLHALEANPDWGADPPDWFPQDLRAVVASDEALREATLARLRAHHVEKAILSGHGDLPAAWKKADPDRLVVSRFLWDPDLSPEALAQLEADVRAGRFAAIGEVCGQYQNKVPDAFEPLFALAERLDVPIAVHMGPGPKDGGGEDYHMADGRPLLLEGVLDRHPGVRLQVMHAGWPFLDEMLALLWSYPNAYVDVAVIDWYIPRAEFHAYLKRLVEAGFGKRIMYGSDQMWFPGAIDRSIAAIESAPFLTAAQKRDILHDNAARFYRLGPAASR